MHPLISRSALIMLSVCLPNTNIMANILNVPDDFETIQVAIDEAEDGDTVLVQPGMYVENIDYSGKAIAVIGSPENPSETVIDADGDGTVVTFTSDEGDRSLLDGFTVQNGGDPRGSGGGGIRIRSASPILKHLIIQNNTGVADGAGIMVCNGGTPVISDIIIRDNGDESIVEGGGLGCYTGSIISINNSLFSGNFATHGSQIACWNAELHLKNATIIGEGTEEYTIEAGGAISISSSTAILDSVYVSNGIAMMGGGIYIDRSDVDLNFVVVNDNQALTMGGGIFIWGGSINAKHLTVTRNSCLHDMGGGMFIIGDVSIINSIFWNNEAEEGAEICYEGGSLEISFSYIEGGQERCELNGDDLDWGVGIISQIPRFVDFERGDFHLNEDSPCIDVGMVIDYPFFGEAPDLGAFEFGMESVQDFQANTILPAVNYSIYPNPFNSRTCFRFELPTSQVASLTIFDTNGREVTTLADGIFRSGRYDVTWNAGNLSGGMYLARLKTPADTRTVKVMLIR